MKDNGTDNNTNYMERVDICNLGNDWEDCKQHLKFKLNKNHMGFGAQTTVTGLGYLLTTFRSYTVAQTPSDKQFKVWTDNDY